MGISYLFYRVKKTGEMMVVCAQKGQKWHCGGINRMCYNFIFNLDCTYGLKPRLTKRSELNTWTQIKSKMPDVKGRSCLINWQNIIVKRPAFDETTHDLSTLITLITLLDIIEPQSWQVMCCFVDKKPPNERGVSIVPKMSVKLLGHLREKAIS